MNYPHVAVQIEVPIFHPGMPSALPNQVDPEKDVTFKGHWELFSTGL
jgi:hypothetical protein